MAKQALFLQKKRKNQHFYSTMHCNVPNNTYLCAMIFHPKDHKWRRVLRRKPVQTSNLPIPYGQC